MGAGAANDQVVITRVSIAVVEQALQLAPCVRRAANGTSMTGACSHGELFTPFGTKW
jgi:hypothetical protein